MSRIIASLAVLLVANFLPVFTSEPYHSHYAVSLDPTVDVKTPRSVNICWEIPEGAVQSLILFSIDIETHHTLLLKSDTSRLTYSVKATGNENKFCFLAKDLQPFTEYIASVVPYPEVDVGGGSVVFSTGRVAPDFGQNHLMLIGVNDITITVRVPPEPSFTTKESVHFVLVALKEKGFEPEQVLYKKPTELEALALKQVENEGLPTWVAGRIQLSEEPFDLAIGGSLDTSYHDLSRNYPLEPGTWYVVWLVSVTGSDVTVLPPILEKTKEKNVSLFWWCLFFLPNLLYKLFQVLWWLLWNILKLLLIALITYLIWKHDLIKKVLTKFKTVYNDITQEEQESNRNENQNRQQTEERTSEHAATSSGNRRYTQNGRRGSSESVSENEQETGQITRRNQRSSDEQIERRPRNESESSAEEEKSFLQEIQNYLRSLKPNEDRGGLSSMFVKNVNYTVEVETEVTLMNGIPVSQRHTCKVKKDDGEVEDVDVSAYQHLSREEVANVVRNNLSQRYR